MKRVVLFIALCFCATGVLLWCGQNLVGRWEPAICARLERGIGAAVHGRVSIDDVSLSFIHRIRLSNIRVWDADHPAQLLFRASEASLTLSLLDLPRALFQHRPLESIGRISVESPWLVLSPEALQRRSLSHGRARNPLPFLFTLTWDHGTFQWKDPRAPHGAWTLYQAQGVYRIRGPKTDFAARGMTEQARSVRFQFSSLGKRWNAQTYVQGGSLPGVLALWEHFFRRPLLAPKASLKGAFNLTLRAAGRRWPGQNEPVW